MPELPEVEAIMRYLVDRGIVGTMGHNFIVEERQVVYRVDPYYMQNWTVDGIQRRGKYLVLPIRPSPAGQPPDMRIVMHMGMTGSLHFARFSCPGVHKPTLHDIRRAFVTAREEILEGRPAPTSNLCSFTPDPNGYLPDLRHVRGAFQLGGAGWLFLNDPRRFARVYVISGDESLPLGALGPDPADLTPSDFAQRLRPRRARIKAALLDQRLIAGIGNIYADEALHAARISPNRRCYNVSRDRLQRLHQAAVAVLERAVRHIVANPAPDGSPYVVNAHDGRFTLPRAVAATPADAAESADEDGAGAATAATPCPRCGPAQPLSSRRIVGRTTVYCARCQR